MSKVTLNDELPKLLVGIVVIAIPCTWFYFAVAPDRKEREMFRAKVTQEQIRLNEERIQRVDRFQPEIDWDKVERPASLEERISSGFEESYKFGGDLDK
ncbi:MAG: hypothetical protein KDB22_09530 [Planctomycetales bacterium]|nr:hypothetical protein [Planctomycetales bacterium]